MHSAAAAARSDENLLDLIYDAPFDETLWTVVLEALAERCGAYPANLIEIDLTDGHGSGWAARAPEDVIASYFADWAHLNPFVSGDRLASHCASWSPAILRDTDCIGRRELEHSVFHNEFMTPIEAEHSLIMRLSLDGFFATNINLGRPARQGAFEDAEIAAVQRFQPHLIRANRMRRALGMSLAQLEQLDEVLEKAPGAWFFLDETLKVRRWSVAADVLLERSPMLRVVDGQLRVTSSIDQAALDRLMTDALRDVAPPKRVALTGRAAHDTLILSVARMGMRSVARFAGARGLLVSVTGAAAATTEGAWLRDRFGLTPAEIRLTTGLLAGDSLRAMSIRHAVSINTVRNQLAAVFDKTGCRRQQDLVRLLGSWQAVQEKRD